MDSRTETGVCLSFFSRWMFFRVTGVMFVALLLLFGWTGRGSAQIVSEPDWGTQLNGRQIEIPALQTQNAQYKGSSATNTQSFQSAKDHFTPRNTGGNGLSDYFVKDLFVDSNNRLFVTVHNWLGHYIDVFDGNSWQHIDVGKELTAPPMDIAEDGSGNLWFGTKRGVFALTSDLAPTDTVDLSGLTGLSDRAGHLEVGGDGRLWVTGFFGVGRYDGSSWSYFDGNVGLAYTYVWKVHAAADGTVWFGTTEGGLTYWENGDFKIMNQYGTFFGESIFEDSRGHMWFGSNGGEKPGVLQYDGISFTRHDTIAGVIGPRVTSFAEDDNGHIIAATSGSDFSGFARYDTAAGTWSSWQPHPDKDIFGAEIHSGPSNNVWIPADDSLYKWDGQQLESFASYAENPLPARHVEVDPSGHVWIGSGQDLYVFDGETWEHKSRGPRVYDITHGPDGDTWVGTYLNGVYKYEHEEIVAIDDEEAPRNISLGQNYPNPFNPSTQIEFTLPRSGQVTLGVYNLLGQQVATLIDGTRPAGTHQVTFDAGELSSGLYLYRLETEHYSRTRKMMLVK